MMLIAAILSSFTFLGRNLVRNSNQQQLETQSRRALVFLAKDIHAATDLGTCSSSGMALALPYVHSDGTVTTYSVTYTYDSVAGTLTRTVAGTAPPGVSTATLTMLVGVPSFSFNYLDRQGAPVDPTYPLRVKQIELAGFTATVGTAAVNTQSSLVGASARLTLRSRHIVN